MARTKGITPQECIVDVVTSLHERRLESDVRMTEHYETTCLWMQEIFESCKRKILEGSDTGASNSKRIRAEVAEHAIDKENKYPEGVNIIQKSMDDPKPHSELEKWHPRYLEIMSMNVKELRKEIKSVGLEATGLKRDLQNRLLNHYSKNDGEDESEEEEEIILVANEHAILSEPVVNFVKSPDVKRMSTDSIKDSEMNDVADEKGPEIMEERGKVLERVPETNELERVQQTNEPSQMKSRVQLAVAQKEEQIAQHRELAKPADMKVEKSRTGVIVQTFVQSAIRALSPKSRIKKTSPVVAFTISNPQITEPISTSLKKKIVMTATTIMPTKSKSETFPGPIFDPSAKTTNKAFLNSSVKEVISSAESKSPCESGPQTMSKVQNKAQQLAEARKQRLADMRGKSKPVSSTISEPKKNIPVLSSSKLLNTSSATTSGLDLKKQTLAAKMREKHATLNTQPLSSSHLIKPLSTSAQSCLPVVPVTSVKIKNESIVDANMSQARKTTTPEAANGEYELTLRSPMDTYEMSDREESESESDSEGDESKEHKKIPEWAQKSKLLDALRSQYDNSKEGNKLDPDVIFTEVETCDLEAIFDRTKDRYKKRTSSGNWTKDRVTVAEKLTYKRNMGYSQTS